MCVVSNIGDRYGQPGSWPWVPGQPAPAPPHVPQDFQPVWDAWQQRRSDHDSLAERIKALEELLRRGKEFDTQTGQPNCELPEKQARLQKLADELGIKIEFPA